MTKNGGLKSPWTVPLSYYVKGHGGLSKAAKGTSAGDSKSAKTATFLKSNTSLNLNTKSAKSFAIKTA